RERLYLVAVCSDTPIPEVGGSVLVDVDEMAFRGFPGAGGPALVPTTAYLDTGDGFNEEGAVQLAPDPAWGEVDLRFDLPPGRPVRQARWDPAEGRLCRVRLDQVGWVGPGGLVRPVSPTGLPTNGVLGADGEVEFHTLDPIVWLPPVPDGATGLVLRGRL